MANETQKRNYYELLHVSPDAPEEVIKASYRTMMQRLKMHPDLGGDSVTAALLNEAYSVLSNARKRADYDASLNPDNDPGEVADIDADMPVPEPPAAPQRPVDPTLECVFCFMPHEHGKSIFANARCVVCKSPLAIADQKRLESGDARAVQRINKKQSVRFLTEWPQAKPYPGRTDDISLNGMRLVSYQAVQKGQLLKISCDVLEAVGRVMNVRQQRNGFRLEYITGIAFVTLEFTQSVGGFVSDKA